MPQVQIELSDQLFDLAKLRALEAGFESVGEYVADLMADDLVDDSENFDHLFTPERIAHIDGVLADIKAGGKTYTMEEVREHLAANRAEWIRKNDQ